MAEMKSGPAKVMTSKSNHGIVSSGGVKMAYGKDSSFMSGTSGDERGQTGFAGGDRDTSSSLTGTSAANGRKG